MDKPTSDIILAFVDAAGKILVILTPIVLAWFALKQSQQGKQLNVIHELVNSAMTTALQSDIEANMRDLASQKELIAIKKDAGKLPTQDILDAVLATEAKITRLHELIAER